MGHFLLGLTCICIWLKHDCKMRLSANLHVLVREQVYSTAKETRKFDTLKLIKNKICWNQEINITYIK